MTIARSAAVAMALVFLAAGATAQSVFINEIHYDNTGTDANERIEIAGPAGTDLTGWSIVLYNGSGGAVYDTDALSGTIPNHCGGFGTVVLSYAVNGIQNGAPDGVALVDASSTVVQFLSYEGTFTAVGGPANGMTSVDIGVAEVGSEALGNSLQLVGSGSAYGDFTWTGPTTATFGACNTGQTFVNTLRIDDVTHAEGAGGATTTYTFTISLAAPAPVGGVRFDAATDDGSATVADGDYQADNVDDVLIPEGQQSATFAVTVYDDATYEPDETFVVNLFDVVGVPIGDGQGMGTIVDDDGVAVSVNDVSQVEGAAGASTFTFTVSLSRPAKAGGVSFDIATADGTATVADGDYDERWLTDQFIPAGATSATFDVTVNGDTAFEGDETFLVQVTGVAGTDAYLADGEGVGTVVNDDAALLVINEIDYDQPTPPTSDSAEFVELYNRSAAAIDLGPYSLRLINGDSGGATTYDTIDLPDVILAPGDYFVVCANAATVPNCDLDDGPNTDFLQNGAPDAVALFENGVLVDAVSYEGNTGAPYTEGSGAGLIDDGTAVNAGISRYPDGTDTGANATDLSLRCITPGLANVAAASGCPTPYLYGVRINELDADTPGTDTAEFVELFDGGKGSVPLDGLVVVFYNGSTDLSYAAYDLDTYVTDATGYFVICGDAANVPNCALDVTPNSDLVQNGQDAVALYRANATDFPLNTPVTTANLQDAIVYDTNDADDAGLLVLLNAGQPQVNESATGASDAVSNQRCPSGYGGLRNTSSYVQMAPTPGVAGVCAFEIFTIQGSGMASPFAGFPVTTNDNVVTAVGPEGFFIQTPDARADADANGTSNGIYVYTGSAPSVAVGNQVDVTGTVQEFFDFTELAGTPSITVDAAVPVAPLAVAFDAATPSPLQPQPANALERYEGMLVTVAAGVVSGPSQHFGTDPTAEAFVVAGPARPFRETGIEYPGLGGGLPVWDGNPEVFELDSDKFLEAVDPIAAGSTFSASGVLGYEYGGYELWATSLVVNQPTLPLAVRSRAAGELTIGSLNTLRLYDDVDDPGSADNGDVEPAADYDRHLAKLARYVVEVLGAPDVLGVQEVEHINALKDLADEILTAHGIAYDAYLEEGNDVGGIDVGFLVRSDTMANEVITQLGKDERLSVDNSLLHDRPPLLLDGNYVGNGTPFPIRVLVVHQRSLTDIETSARVRQKRLEQAQSVAKMVQDLQDADPAVRLVVLGDFNAYEFTDGYVDVVGQIKGSFVAADNLLSGPDLVDPDLYDQVLDLPETSRYSFVFNGTAQVLDHALTSQGIAPFVRGLEYGRGNADAPEVFFYDDSTAQRCSDHDGLVLFVMTDADGNGYPDDAPQFALFNNANGRATGTVSDPSGIASLVLGPGSANVVLTPSGAVGDGVWGWSVTLANAELAGQAELIATDVDGREARFVVALGSHAAVPATSAAGLALLALLLGLAGALALGRRTLLG